MRRLIVLGVIAFLLLVHTVVTDRETKDAEESHGGKIIELAGGDLSYKDEGDRDDPVIVLLHGFACSLRWWDRVAPDLARRGLHVIRFDLLGHGGSEMPRDGYEMEEQARLVGGGAAKAEACRRATSSATRWAARSRARSSSRSRGSCAARRDRHAAARRLRRLAAHVRRSRRGRWSAS